MLPDYAQVQEALDATIVRYESPAPAQSSLPRLHIDYEWKTRHTVQEGLYIGLLTADYLQTRWFLKHSQCDPRGNNCKFGEADVSGMLGHHPSMAKFTAIVALSAVGHATIAYLLPAPFRDIWQYAWIGIEYSAIKTNYSAGVRFAL